MFQKIKTMLLSIVTLLFLFLLIKYPEQSLEASLRGLEVWWEVVFPSLLPFFILAELLISLGVVVFIGQIFEPIMRPLFRMSGAGSFALIMGMASGYPSGAKISVRLYEEKKLTKNEAERLVAFTNNASPLFIFGAISVGFLHSPQIGLLLGFSHYVGNFIVGLLMRFYGKNEKKEKKTSQQRSFSLAAAFYTMHEARIKDKRPFGQLLGDAVIHSVQTLVMVGGFIIFFSVFTSLLQILGFTEWIANGFQLIFNKIDIPPILSLPFFTGLFEISIGSQLISQTKVATIIPKAVLISFLLGFNGLSIQAQVASILAKTDLSLKPYLIGRILHGGIASLLTILFIQPLYLDRKSSIPTSLLIPRTLEAKIWTKSLFFFESYGPLLTLFCLYMACILIFYRLFKSRSNNDKRS